jgi:hypothetical protein
MVAAAVAAAWLQQLQSAAVSRQQACTAHAQMHCHIAPTLAHAQNLRSKSAAAVAACNSCAAALVCERVDVCVREQGSAPALATPLADPSLGRGLRQQQALASAVLLVAGKAPDYGPAAALVSHLMAIWVVHHCAVAGQRALVGRQ